MSLREIFISTLVVLGTVNCQTDHSNKTRIVGGSRATEPIPYQISLQVKRNKPVFQLPFLSGETGEWAHICGGSIIGKSYVLTAAHCVEGGKPDIFSVLAGTSKRREGGSRHLVEWIKIHPNYKKLVTSDIAILKIKTPFEFSEKVQTIELEDTWIGGGVPVKLSGWGYNIPIRVGNIPEDLQTMDYKTMTNKECKERGFDVTKTEICTYKFFLQGACAGDSGGPLVNKDRTKQIGVVSYGSIICATGRPDAFTRVSEFIKWIKEEMDS